MTIEEAREYWSMRLERAESYSVEHLDADERHAYADYIDALQHAITALAVHREYEEGCGCYCGRGDGNASRRADSDLESWECQGNIGG